MRKRSSRHLPVLAFGFALLALPVLATEPVTTAPGDVLDFCAVSLPDDAAKKAQDFGWNRIDGQDLESLRALVDPIGDRMQSVQAWQKGSTPDSDVLVYSYEAQASDGSFMSMLKSFASKPHSCLYLASGDTSALRKALSDRLGTPGDQSEGNAFKWETSSTQAILREFPGTDDPHSVSLLMFYE